MTEEKRKWHREYWRKNAVVKRKQWRDNHNTKEFKESRREYNKLWRKNNHDKVKEYRAKYLEKMRARDKFKYAIKTGKIIRQPCQECGNVKSEGHHTDYTKPLEVIWLCRNHHRKSHII